MRRAAAVLGLACAAIGGYTAGAGVDGFVREVDEYAHGIFRLRVRPADYNGYQVSDVLVADAENSLPEDAQAPFKSGASSLAFEGTRATFTSTAAGEQKAQSISVQLDNLVPGSEPAAAAGVSFPQAQRLYGIPEHATDLSLKDGLTYRLMNLDVYMYKLDDPGGIYGSKPFMHAHSEHGTVGFFWLNSADTNVAVKKGDAGWDTTWTSIAGVHDMFFLPGPTPADVLRQYSYLTGASALHPLFSMGYHQCRWNYRSEEDMLSVDEGFDEHYIPYDVLWLDIEHTDGKKYFTWDSHNFPDPARMINKIASKGRKVVTISDPHIKRASGYHVHDTATEKGYYVKTETGADYEGDCWPGRSSWLDYYSAKVRTWYASLYRYDMYPGSTPDVYTWIDMNEPSVFNSPEVTMDVNAVHKNDDGLQVKHKLLHNMYGYYQTMSTYQGLYERTLEAPHTKPSRPFILSRSFFSGSQRFAAVWTGDNLADWSHLDKSIPMLLSMSVAGLTFVGADVGGFFQNPEEELLVRWYQIGAFYPFFRAHAHLETKRREPWVFGEARTAQIRTSIVSRYQLMPYIYTQFWRAHRVGESVIMPLYFEFPEDAKVFDIDRQMLLGKAIMVKPVVAAGLTTVDMYLPGAHPWYNLYSGQQYAAGTQQTLPAPVEERLPALLRGGHIVPRRERVRRSTAAQFWDPITLVVGLDTAGQAAGDLYLDDTHSFDYQQGAFVHKQYKFEKNILQSLTFDDASPYGKKFPGTKDFNTEVVVERVKVYGLTSKPDGASITFLGGETKDISSNLQWDDAAKILTVKQPGARVSGNWHITFAKPAAAESEL